MEKERVKHGLQIEFREQMVGLFIVITLGLALAILVFIGRGQRWFKKRVTYYTYFDEGYNLKPGAQVKLFNTWIGSVDDVDLTEDNRVKITIKVFKDDAEKIREDSVATVDSPTIIGSEYIAISPGSRNKPQIPEDGTINSKAKKKLGEYLEEYQVEKKIKDLGTIISDLKVVVEHLKDPEGPLFGILYDVRDVTDKVKEGQGNLGRLVMEDEVYKNIKDAIRDLKEASLHIKEVSENMAEGSRSLPDTMKRINETSEKLEKVMTRLQSATKRAPAMQRQVEDALTEVNRILKSLKKSFLIRPNLPAPPKPKVHVPELRGVER